jgi:hypothetical protein
MGFDRNLFPGCSFLSVSEYFIDPKQIISVTAIMWQFFLVTFKSIMKNSQILSPIKQITSSGSLITPPEHLVLGQRVNGGVQAQAYPGIFLLCSFFFRSAFWEGETDEPGPSVDFYFCL